LWPTVCRHIAKTHPDPLFIKSHARWPNKRTQSAELARATAGVVLIVRHPADVAVSLSHFFDLSLDRAIEIMADTSFCYNHPPGGIMESLPEWAGSWSTHLNSWLDSGLRLHLVKYEDLSADPEAALRGRLSFADLSVSSTAVKRAIQQTTLANLQTTETNTGFCEAPTNQRSFFRSGIVGSAQTMLTAAQLDALTQIHGKTMLRTGYS
jgi:aryl sulfotransferase